MICIGALQPGTKCLFLLPQLFYFSESASRQLFGSIHHAPGILELDEVGFFDETFFLYFEETDFCRRARLLGWDTWYLPSSRVVHIGSVSTGMKKLDEPMPRFWFDSRAHYLRKNHGRLHLALANLIWIGGTSIFRLRCFVQRKPDAGRPRMLRDFILSIFTPSADSGGSRRD